MKRLEGERVVQDGGPTRKDGVPETYTTKDTTLMTGDEKGTD